MAIEFQEGFMCIPSGSDRSLTSISLDRSNTFTSQFGTLTTINTDGTYGNVYLRYENKNVSGNIMLGFNGIISFADLANWYNAHGHDLPLNLVQIPFENQIGDIKYLVFTAGLLTLGNNYGTVYYDYSFSLCWTPDLEDYSRYVSIKSVEAGSWMATDQRSVMFDAFYITDEAFAGGLSPEDFPLYDKAIGFYFSRYLLGPQDPTSLYPLNTDNYGEVVVPSPAFTVRRVYFMPIRNIALNGYGRPSWINESPEVGPPSEEGGYDPDRPGAFDNSSDDITIPSDPTLGVSSVGFVRVYNTGLNQLTALGLELFPPLTYTPPVPISDNQSVSEAIVDGFNQIVTFLANIPSFFDQFMANTLINYVIDCHMIPVSPGSGSSEAIHVGPKTLTTTAGRIYTDYVNKSCGSISVGEYYGNFADYYANAKLYLPFVGFVPTRPEWFTGSTLSVDYKFNVIDGSFCCYVRAGGKHVGNGGSTIVAQYAGNACVHLPITGPSYAAMASGLVGAGAGMIAGAATGNVAAVATSAIGAMTSHGDIASSNAYNGSAAFLSCRYPFLMIERPVSSWARNYQHEIGIPANVYATLSDVSGFCTMENVHVDGISGATETEKAEIKRLLAQGVIV